ncbi:MAG: type II toxin-antitoxin system VapC family toxin [Candidatus Aenigmarchaeota archaeon]|nr:type II toxin-antitoxin system VapC family toxin [Candidatus Aenigmarchaeota archaeon]
MENIVFDSDILIDLVKGAPKVVETVKKLEVENELYTTDINAFELYWGAYKSKYHEKELASVKGLLNTFRLIGTNENSMEVAAKIIADLEKKGKPVALRDLFIGAMCLANSFRLFTRNTKHFKNMEGLKIIEVE